MYLELTMAHVVDVDEDFVGVMNNLILQSFSSHEYFNIIWLNHIVSSPISQNSDRHSFM